MAERSRRKKMVAKRKGTTEAPPRQKKVKPKPREQTKAEQMTERADQMLSMRGEGYTLQDIAGEFGVTRQRVHQLVAGSVEIPVTRSNHSDKSTPNPDLLRGRGVQGKVQQFEEAHRNAAEAKVGDRIVYKRMRRGLALGALSLESGVPYGVLSNYENNKSLPNCANLRKLCVALRCSAHWILFGEGYTKSWIEGASRRLKRASRKAD